MGGYTVTVNGLAGPLCTLTVHPWDRLRDLKQQIERVTFIPSSEQELISASGELVDELWFLSDVELTLVRVPVERSILLDAVRAGQEELKRVAVGYRQDKEVVLAAVQQCGLALEHASVDLRRDLEVVTAAVRNNGV